MRNLSPPAAGFLVAACLLLGVVAVPAGAAGPDYTPFVDAAGLVDQQYHDFLGRAPTSEEVSQASADLEAMTIGVDAYIAGFVPRALDRPDAKIIRLYVAALGRWPDLGGLAYWEARTGDLTAVARFFTNSREFRRRYPSPTDAQFVELLYGNVLDRRPDPAGLAYWTGRIATVGRPAVLLAFSESSENLARAERLVLLIRISRSMLGAMPPAEPFGIVFGPEFRALATGQFVVAVVEVARTSPAYATRIAACDPGLARC